MHLLLLISGCLLGWTGVWGQHDHHVPKEEKKVILGDKVVLPCNVFKPDELATVHWLYVIPEDKVEKVQNILTAGPKGIVKENSELRNRINLKNNSKLEIVSLQVQDNKQFICRVEFQNGVTKESRIQLNVYKSPSEPELKMEQNGIQVTNEAVKIGTCESKNGFPVPVIKWYKSDRPLRDGKDGVKIHTQVATGSAGLITVTSTLLTPVQQSDSSALFYCDVSYSLPMGDHMLESERKNITVHYPTTSIKVYFKSPSEIIKEGDNVSLICEGNGNPQPSYSLEKKGNDNDTTLTEDMPYSWKVSREDSGVYVCKSFDVDTLLDFEEETTLHVYFLDPPVLSPESPVNVDLQSKMTVSCQATASNETVVHWKQDENIIANGPVLNLDFVDYSVAGLYTCVVDLPNVIGMTTSKDISIAVQGSPQASVTSQVMEVQDGDTVTTNCTVFGYPQPQVTWYINDTEVTSQAVLHYIKDNELKSELTLRVYKNVFNQSLKCVALNRFNISTAYIQLLEKSMTTPFSVTSSEFVSTWTDQGDWSTAEPIGTRAPEPESRIEKSYGIVIVIVIICILILAILGAVLYFLYKKGHIPCGRSGKKDITNPGAKDKIIVEMKPDSPAEESVLLTGSQEKKPSDQEKYIDLRN